MSARAGRCPPADVSLAPDTDIDTDSVTRTYPSRITAHDAYAFTLLRWGGIAGIDPKSLPGYFAYIEGVMAAAPVAAALERERVKLDTYKPA